MTATLLQTAAPPVSFVGGRVLSGDVLLPEATLICVDERVAGIGEGSRGSEVDARGLLVLPGLVDLHGDAIERALQPRPGVEPPFAIAFEEDARALLAAGITTAYSAVTDGFEPGLRSRATVRRVLAELARPAAPGPRRLVHLRHERCQVEDPEEVTAWLAGGRIHLLSFADHLPAQEDPRHTGRFLAAMRRRLGHDSGGLERLVADAALNRQAGAGIEARLAAVARAIGVPLASHDDGDPAQVQASVERGCTICEFPADIPTAAAARAAGMAVLMGAPNCVRGGSHIGCMGVAEALAAGQLDALASDYHYPSLFHAPFALARRGALDLAAAWRLGSAAPAAAAGLGDRGILIPGRLADLLLVEPGPPPRLRAVWVGGREVARWG